MVKDPDFRADAMRLNFDLAPMSGEDLQAFFTKSDYPPALLERAKEVAKLAGH